MIVIRYVVIDRLRKIFFIIVYIIKNQTIADDADKRQYRNNRIYIVPFNSEGNVSYLSYKNY